MGSGAIPIILMFFVGFPDEAPWFVMVYWLALTWWALIDLLFLFARAERCRIKF